MDKRDYDIFLAKLEAEEARINYKKYLDELMDKGEFKPLPFWRELLLDSYLLPTYYNAKRRYLYENGKLLTGLGWREKLHPALLGLMSLYRKYFNKQTIKVLNDRHTESDKPVIYAITHIGMYDYQIVSELIKKHQIPFAGDPETLYRSGDGLLLALNGLVYCDTEDKTDRKIAAETAKEVLNTGHNLLIYPEGVWNVTPNLLMLPLYPGIIRMAKETGCDIVPIAIEQYDKDFIINVGENFKVEDLKFNDKEQEKEYVETKKRDLRDNMATLKWEIFESLPREERKNIGEYAKKHKEFVDTRFNEWFNKKENKPYYNPELVKHRTFKPKNIEFAEDVFSYLPKVKLNKNNAFMFGRDVIYPVDMEEIRNKVR